MHRISWIFAALVALGVGGLWFAKHGAEAGCQIKGNISLDGERIYHLPGQEYYAVARVDGAGERWFCSEEEARAAGWRKSRM